MTQLSDEVVERVARALMREANGGESADEWCSPVPWIGAAREALKASGHAELVEALSSAMELLDDIECGYPFRYATALARAKGEAPPNVG